MKKARWYYQCRFCSESFGQGEGEGEKPGREGGKSRRNKDGEER